MASERIKGWPLRKKQRGSASGENNALDRPLRIGEAAKLVGVEAYVLRFWETQFRFIRPKQSRSRHRYYTQADIETLKMVKRLLHTERYTIAGARRFVREKGLESMRLRMGPEERAAAGRRTKERLDAVLATSVPSMVSNGIHRTLLEIREDLRALQKLLDTC
jgi:DNA-binding transcriptional MerR regulator